MNSERESVDVLILGAGLTGLAVAERLMGKGLKVAVLEKEAYVGGLARSLDWRGFKADIGGHRLYFENRDLFAEIVALIGEDRLIKHARKSSAYRDGKFLKYPPQLRNSMASAVLLSKTLWDAAGLCGRKTLNPLSLKDWVLNNFGPTIHDAYFKQYTRKVWGLETDEMSAIWAQRRIGGLNAFQLIRELAVGARSKEAVSEFYYPRGGMGDLSVRLHDRIRTEVRVIREAELLSLGGDRDTLSLARFRSPSGEECLKFGKLVSTIPITALARALSSWRMEFKSLSEGVKYRDLLIAYVAVSRRPVFEEHWVYFPEERISFSRVCEFDNWCDGMAGGDGALLGCEIFCGRADRLWNSTDDEIAALAARSLQGLGFVTAEEIQAVRVLRVPYAYPLLYLGYEKALNPLLRACESVPNLRLAGRTGTHSYFDMEECLEDAKRVYRCLT